METSGQLYLSPAPVTIPACLPHCPEGNSSLSWCRRGWQGEPGLSSLRAGRGTRPAAVAAATVLLGRVALPGAQQWGLLPTLPRDTLRGRGGGAAHLCRGFVRLVCLASPGDVQWVPSAGGWGGVMGSALVPWWARGLWAGTRAARVLWQAGGCSGDTGSPGDAQPRPSSNCSLTSQHAGWGSAGPQ